MRPSLKSSKTFSKWSQSYLRSETARYQTKADLSFLRVTQCLKTKLLVSTPADNDLFLHEHLTGGHGLWVDVRHFDNVVLSRSAFKQKTST